MKYTFLKNKSGFTLVELMVAISIIGILSAIVYANFDGARKAARDDIRKTDLKNLQLAIELYKAQNGTYPAQGCGNAGQWAGAGPGGVGAAAEIALCDEYILGLVPDYLPQLPKDPNLEYVINRGYIYRTDGTSYKAMNYLSPEAKFITSYNEDFVRCPRSYSSQQCGSTPQAITYAVYSAGAADW